MNEALQTTLRKLRLSGLAASLDVRLQEAAGNRLGHVEFLELIRRGGPVQEQFEYLACHEIIRDLADYGELVAAALRREPLLAATCEEDGES